MFWKMPLSLFFLFLAVPLYSADWPMGRQGTTRQGFQTNASLQPPLQRKWRYLLDGPVEAPPIIQGNQVFLLTTRGGLYILQLHDGALLFRKGFRDSAFRASAAIEGSHLYLADDAGLLRCFSLESRETLWTFQGQGDCHSPPLVTRDKVILGNYDQHLYALDAQTGELLWRYETEGPVHGGAVLHGETVYIAGCDQTLRGLSLTSGTLEWSLDFGAYASATPTVSRDVLFIPHFGPAVTAVELAARKKIWDFQTEKAQQPFFGSAAVVREKIVVGCRDKRIYGLDSQSGKKIWVHPTGGDVDASPCGWDKWVALGSKDGVLYLLDAETGAVPWKYEGGAPFLVGPVVAGQWLVVADSEGLVSAFGNAEEEP